MASGEMSESEFFVSIDLHVVRRVGENNVSLLAAHERRIGRFLESVTADQTMIPQ
jgi:hypothetical protein